MADKPKFMLVRATQMGVYEDIRRYPLGHGHRKSGEPFWIKPEHFSDSSKKVSPGREGWMEEVIVNSDGKVFPVKRGPDTVTPKKPDAVDANAKPPVPPFRAEEAAAPASAPGEGEIL